MTLKQRKQTHNMPHYLWGKEASADAWKDTKSGGNFGNILSGAASFGSDIYDQFGSVQSSGELQANVNTSENTINGITYQTQSNVNEKDEMSKLNIAGNTIKGIGSGAALGSSIGGPLGAALGGAAGLIGGLVGGIFRKNKLKRRIAIANDSIRRRNIGNMAAAQTTGMTQQYYLDNGSTQDDMLYANKGKDLKQPIKK